MIKCQNCGHDSHCGVTLFGEHRDFVDVPPTKVEICKSCRCEKCLRPDWG